MDAVEEGDLLNRPNILGLIIALVDRPGWGNGTLVDCIEHVYIGA